MNKPSLQTIQFDHIFSFGSLTAVSQVRFENLRAYHIEWMCNGCGPRGWLSAVPELEFHEACQRHDFAYWQGGTEMDRLQADEELLFAMQLTSYADTSFFRAVSRRAVSRIYYVFARMFGGLHWNKVRADSRLLLWDTLRAYGYEKEA